MRILLDECVPYPLRQELPVHDVRTVPEMGWSGKKNGDVLPLITAHHFAVSLTTDQNVRHQQNLRTAGIAVIVLIARTYRLVDLAALMPRVQATLPGIQPGDLVGLGG